MRFFDSKVAESPYRRLFTLSRKSPLKFFSEVIEDLIASIEKRTVPELFMKITGMEESPFFDKSAKDIPGDMDFSQRKA